MEEGGARYNSENGEYSDGALLETEAFTEIIIFNLYTLKNRIILQQI